MPNYSWIKHIKKGDVLESGRGTLRIVRRVTHGEKRTSVSFAIRHPSWTTRPFTTYGETDLKTLGYRPVACKRFPLRTKFDKAFEESMNIYRRPEELPLRAHDVLGVA